MVCEQGKGEKGKGKWDFTHKKRDGNGIDTPILENFRLLLVFRSLVLMGGWEDGTNIWNMPCHVVIDTCLGMDRYCCPGSGSGFCHPYRYTHHVQIIYTGSVHHISNLEPVQTCRHAPLILNLYNIVFLVCSF